MTVVSIDSARNGATKEESLEDLFEENDAIADLRTVFVLEPHNIVETTDALIELLAPHNIYQRGSSLMQIRRSAGRDDRKIVVPIGTPEISMLNIARLSELMDQAARFSMIKTGKGGTQYEVPCSAPAKIAQRIEARKEWSHIRPLQGLSQWPILRADWSLATSSGYDEDTGYYVTQSFPGIIPERPTHADAKRALADLLEVLVDFPISGDAGRAVWLSALLTPIARPAIDGPVPLHFFDANEIGSGKTLAAQLTGIILGGKKFPATSIPDEDAEWQKTLLGLAIAGYPVVLLDNKKGSLGGAELEKVLTSSEYSTRLLGKNETPTYPFNAVLLGTGNNCTLTSDMVRRSIHMRIETDLEMPATRTGFQHDPIEEWVLSERHRLLLAALTIFKAYAAAGCQPVDMATMGSYGAWSRYVRAPLIWAGAADPAITQAALLERADPDRDKATTLFEAWHGAHGDDGIDCATLLRSIAFSDHRDGPEEPATTRLREAVQDLCDTPKGLPTSAAFGHALRALRDKRRGPFVLRGSSANHRKVCQWRVIRCAP